MSKTQHSKGFKKITIETSFVPPRDLKSSCNNWSDQNEEDLKWLTSYAKACCRSMEINNQHHFNIFNTNLKYGDFTSNFF